ncbi:MAG: DUF2235 domain-containing protein [Thermoanaerobaculia bacterium]
MKRLVLFLDGTWNSPERDRAAGGGALYKPTNVLKLHRALLPSGEGGLPQIGVYVEGVGSFVGERSNAGRLQALVDRLFGGLFGGGFEGRVKAACRFLVANWEPGDTIHLFGFSRGAAQAASLARFLDWSGGLLAKRDEYFLPELFRRFTESRAAPGAAREAIAAIRDRRGDPGAIGDPRPAAISFLGLFDPVLALGSRLRADLLEGEVGTVEKGLAFHAGRELPGNVHVARVAVSIDERRWDFRPILWNPPAELADRLELRWFAGVHSNVGGGYPRDGLANFPLYWMASEARAAGLDFDRSYLRNFRPNPKGDRPDEWRGWIRWSERLRGKSGRGVRRLDPARHATAEIDLSVFRLMLQDETYRPRNLLAALALRPDLAGDLPEEPRRRLLELAAAAKP